MTERLKRSHEVLAREVCRLRDEVHEKNCELARRERLAALGEMAAGVAHEIRNPLGGIGLYVSLLERDLGDRPEQLEVVRKIAGGIVSMETIVGDILAFAGDRSPKPHDLPFGRIISATEDRVGAKLRARGVALDRDVVLDAIVVHCDAGQIEQALTNLVLNAVDAAGEGGLVGLKRHGNGALDGVLQVAVEDSGPGIPRENLQRIFDPFFTTKDSGTGLGLAIVHRIAEANGGSVRAECREGGGARFVLSMPLALGHGEEGDD